MCGIADIQSATLTESELVNGQGKEPHNLLTFFDKQYVPSSLRCFATDNEPSQEAPIRQRGLGILFKSTRQNTFERKFITMAPSFVQSLDVDNPTMPYSNQSYASYLSSISDQDFEDIISCTSGTIIKPLTRDLETTSPSGLEGKDILLPAATDLGPKEDSASNTDAFLINHAVQSFARYVARTGSESSGGNTPCRSDTYPASSTLWKMRSHAMQQQSQSSSPEAPPKAVGMVSRTTGNFQKRRQSLTAASKSAADALLKPARARRVSTPCITLDTSAAMRLRQCIGDEKSDDNDDIDDQPNGETRGIFRRLTPSATTAVTAAPTVTYLGRVFADDHYNDDTERMGKGSILGASWRRLTANMKEDIDTKDSTQQRPQMADDLQGLSDLDFSELRKRLRESGCFTNMSLKFELHILAAQTAPTSCSAGRQRPRRNSSCDGHPLRTKSSGMFRRCRTAPNASSDSEKPYREESTSTSTSIVTSVE